MAEADGILVARRASVLKTKDRPGGRPVGAAEVISG
jgi:hypothetical protein